MLYAEMEPINRKIPAVIRQYNVQMGNPPDKQGAWIFGLAKEHEWDARAADRDLHLQKIREQQKETVVAEEARKEAVDIEAMRQELHATFNSLNENTKVLVDELLGDEQKRKTVSVQGLTGLLRTQLDIARYLDGDKADPAADAQRDQKKKAHAEKLFSGS